MAVTSIIFVFLVPGLAGWLSFGKQLREKVTFIEASFLIILGSIIATSWIAIVLAEIKMFSLPTLIVLLLIGSLLLVGWAVRNGRVSNPFKNVSFSLLSLLIVPILALAIWLSPHPYEYINGGRDHGLYVNAGIHIARDGSIFYYDSELAAVPSESKQLLINPAISTQRSLLPGPWSQGRRLPGGMTIRDLERGIVTPQSFHLYPVWIAIFAAAGGVNFALMTTTVLGILGILSVYVAGARLFGQPIGLLTSLLLAINLAQIWYTRTPSAEILLVDVNDKQPLCGRVSRVEFWSNALNQTGHGFRVFYPASLLPLSLVPRPISVYLLVFRCSLWPAGNSRYPSCFLYRYHLLPGTDDTRFTAQTNSPGCYQSG